jgi:hypothetical protein
MAKANLEFKQSEYMPGRGGHCLSIVARWTHSMLRANKDMWGGPKPTVQERFAPFYLFAEKNDIAQAQGLYARKNQRWRDNLDAMGQAVAVLRILNRQGFQPAAGAVSSALVPVVNGGAAANERNIRTTIETFGVRVIRDAESAWTGIAAAITQREPIVLTFQTAQAGHAIGIYKTGGVMSNDYYVFDPNFGEYLCAGDDDFTRLMGAIRKVTGYGSPTRARAYAVALA